jgi:cytochrome P450
MHRTALVDFTFTSNPTAGPILVRKGETVASAMDAVHQNPKEYENPAEFRPWRFYDEGKGEPSVAYTTTSADFLGFGFGQHAW